MSVERGEICGELAAAWKRQVTPFMSNEDGTHIFAVYADEALTAWASFQEKPDVGKFRDNHAICVPIAHWLMLKALADATVTPIIVLAKGQKIKQKIFAPHTGLKYPVRNIKGKPQLMIYTDDFEEINGRSGTSKTGNDHRRKRG